jgi:hypothetical protein
MSRQGRLASARSWLPKYSGKNVLKGYCKHFGVDWRCATVELAMLGVKIDPAYLAMRETTEAEKTRQRKERKKQQEAEESHVERATESSPVLFLLRSHFAQNPRSLCSESLKFCR